jgi:hypothetical protein
MNCDGGLGVGSLKKKENALAKNRIPKKIAGFKIPKMIRKNAVLSALLASPTGRQILGQALVAGAAAAAAVLTASRSDDIADAGKGAAKRGKKAGNLATRAVKDAAGAMVGVISDAASSILPDQPKRAPSRRISRERRAATH